MHFSKRIYYLILLHLITLFLNLIFDSDYIVLANILTFIGFLYFSYTDVLKPLRTFNFLNKLFLEDKFNAFISDVDQNSDDIISGTAKSYNKLSAHLKNHLEIKNSVGELVRAKKMLLKELEIRKALESSTELYLQQLERMYDNVEEFSYMTSHDLKAPLKTLVNFIELLIEDIEEDNKESIEEDLVHIKKTAQRMDNIIGNIIELAKSGITVLFLQSFNLNILIESILSSLKTSIEEKNITISFTLETIMVNADKILISRVIQNLISNGIKFSSKGSKINILAIENTKEWIIKIQDFGIGIKKDELNNIFQPFNRLNNLSEYEGSGIGLAICKKIVDRHNGDIWVESEFGKGSEFIFTISKGLETIYEQTKSATD